MRRLNRRVKDYRYKRIKRESKESNDNCNTKLSHAKSRIYRVERTRIPLGRLFDPLNSQATLRRNIKKETVSVYDINCGCS